MLLPLLLIFFLISFFLLYLGFYENNSIIKIVGFFLLFVSGSIILINGIDIKTGENITTYNCEYLINTTLTTNISSSNTESINNYMYVCDSEDYNYNTIIKNNIYSNYKNKTLGIWLMIVSFLGWLCVYLQIKGENNEE